MSEVDSIEYRIGKQVLILFDLIESARSTDQTRIYPPRALSEPRQRVTDALTANTWLTPAQLGDRLEVNPNTLRSTLKKMLFRGQIVRSQDGRYSLPA